MRSRLSLRGILWLGLALFAPTILGCGLGGTATVVVTPTGPAPTHTPVPPPPHAITWNQLDGSGTPQIWASINDGAPTQITHAALGTIPPCGLPFYGAAMFSPDLHHLVAATGGCSVDAQIYGGLYVVDATTGVGTAVPLPGSSGVLTNQRSYGWIDNNTIFAIGTFGSGSYGAASYTLGSSAVTQLPGIPASAREGVVRGTTLWYVTETDAFVGGYEQVHTLLHRYSLSSHTETGSPLDLGSYGAFQGSPGDYHLQGWDVSADGAHVVYQYTTPQPFVEAAGQTGIHTQTIYYANSDGSGATAIVQYMVTNSQVRMRFSPNGQLVGITDAFGTPDVLSGCVNSPGHKGDPCLQFYSPDADAYPAWHWDSASMVTESLQANSNGARVLYQNIPGHFTSAVYAAHGNSPWSTPES